MRIFKDKADFGKHALSLALSLLVHAAILYFLVVHFAAVRIIDFPERVTSVIIAPPPPGLRLPGGKELTSNLPPVDQDFSDFIPRSSRRPPEPLAIPEGEGPSGSPSQPVDSRFTSGFRLDQPKAKESAGAEDRLRLTIPERRGSTGGGVGGTTSPGKKADLRKYLYSGASGGRGPAGAYGSGGRPARGSLRGRTTVAPSIKSYDLSAWARNVVEIVQKNWVVPLTQTARSEESVEISVVILKSGEISTVMVVEPSEDRLFDQAAREAIEASLPFPSLPENFPAASLGISFVFARQ
jgi:TonB family protein